MAIVTGDGPQSKVMTPPAATAFTTAAEVQLAGVPSPIVRSGRLVSTALAAAGTAARPDALPGRGSFLTAGGLAVADTGADVAGLAGGVTATAEGGVTDEAAGAAGAGRDGAETGVLGGAD
ncbi:hypothetical protein GCM10025331_81230 [Actinoplanes utahensis]|nr:hypothetical protein Aut01nite_30690 [Actinoplanes utahensis]